MDPHIARSDEKDVVTIECRMCHRLVPKEHSGTLSGRILCFGCLSGWYGDDEEEEE
jgi:formylmethanofuran dehydrogenase subunit E